MKNKLKPLAIAIGSALLGMHIGTHLSYVSNTKPDATQAQQTFAQEYGIPLHGWYNDLEANPDTVSTLNNVFYRELRERPFDVSKVEIVSDNYWKKPILEQVVFLTKKPFEGMYNPIDDSILLSPGADSGTIHHEIKHARTHEAPEELLQQWSELAVDAKGNTLYEHPFRTSCTRLRGIGSFVNKERKPQEENERLGFISNYARTNVLEDIAELGEMGEVYYIGFIPHLGYSRQIRFIPHLDYSRQYSGEKNERIAAKVALAQEYGILPAEFSEFVELQSFVHQPIPGGWSQSSLYYSDKEMVNEFFSKSEQFLSEHCKSIYEAEVRMIRGGFFRDSGDGKKAITEYKMVLPSSMNWITFRSALSQLHQIYRRTGDREKTNLYAHAALYAEALTKDDMSCNDGVLLCTKRINDFLEANGEQVYQQNQSQVCQPKEQQ